jgi:hypothetical protein
MKSAVNELVSPFGVPVWQKSAHWEENSVVTSCTNCHEEFGILKKKHHCRVCGCIFCAKCSASDLFLFMSEGSDPQPMWALNGKEGVSFFWSFKWKCSRYDCVGIAVSSKEANGLFVVGGLWRMFSCSKKDEMG